MAPPSQAWVIKDLAGLLGLDHDSISQMILPDLEGYSNETKLKSHLQDFLGPSPQAKSFTTKYLSLRFPRLSTSEPPPPPGGPLKPLFSQPPQAGGIAGSSRSKPSSSSASATPTTRQPTTQSIPDALEAAFGPGGKVYQKNREADGLSGFFAGGSGGSGRGGSGSATPSTSSVGGVAGGRSNQGMRSAGAMSITEARPRSTGAVGSGGERSNSQKGKARKEEIWDLPKSAAVKKLERLLEDLKGMQAAEGKVKRVEEGKECFCQARVHPLSNYTPQCPSCGLIQCHLQPPDRACPSCFRPLLTPSSLARLLLRVQDDIESQLAREQSARDEAKRAEQRAAEQAAAFPYLAGLGMATSAQQAKSAGTRGAKGHQVLTIGKGKGTGRITLTTTVSTPVPVASTSNITPAEEKYAEGVIYRPRSPPPDRTKVEKELAKTMKWREEEDRPWGDMKAVKKGDTAWTYVEIPIVEFLEDDRVGRRKGRKGRGGGGGGGGGGGDGVNGKSVPGAATITA